MMWGVSARFPPVRNPRQGTKATGLSESNLATQGVSWGHLQEHGELEGSCITESQAGGDSRDAEGVSSPGTAPVPTAWWLRE